MAQQVKLLLAGTALQVRINTINGDIKNKSTLFENLNEKWSLCNKNPSFSEKN
jgi:hypothetical protein